MVTQRQEETRADIASSGRGWAAYCEAARTSAELTYPEKKEANSAAIGERNDADNDRR